VVGRQRVWNTKCEGELNIQGRATGKKMERGGPQEQEDFGQTKNEVVCKSKLAPKITKGGKKLGGVK